MAVINHKILTKDFDWARLSASARVLLNAFEICTNKDGRGSPGWSVLMHLSGIVGKDTFKRARQQLLDFGLITILDKRWDLVVVNGKKLPHATINYQITESILWNKIPSIRNKSSKITDDQSMETGSMVSGKEDVITLGVKDIDVKEQPAAVFEDSYKREELSGNTNIDNEIRRRGLESIKDVLKSKGIYETDSNIKYKWQEHAQRIAGILNLDVNGNNSWFRLFKEAHRTGTDKLLDTAASFCFDYKNPEDLEKLFYWHFNKLLKERIQK